VIPASAAITATAAVPAAILTDALSPLHGWYPEAEVSMLALNSIE
jgi:hypothetical protein